VKTTLEETFICLVELKKKICSSSGKEEPPGTAKDRALKRKHSAVLAGAIDKFAAAWRETDGEGTYQGLRSVTGADPYLPKENGPVGEREECQDQYKSTF